MHRGQPHASIDPDLACARRAEVQHGCLSLEQALECGMSSQAVYRRVASGRWKRLFPRVFAIAGTESSWDQRLMAASLWVGEGCAVSHRAAAAIWQMPDFPRGPVELSTMRRRRPRASSVTVHNVAALNRHEIGLFGAIPVTTATRTLIDLSTCTEEEQLEIAFHYALYRKIATVPRIEWACRQHRGPGHPGAPVLRELLDLYSDCPRPPESPLEVRMFRLLRRSDLPPHERQFEVEIAGRSTYRLDFAWPHAQVAVEVDGYRWHSNRLSWEKDHRKLAALMRAGWDIVQVTDDGVRQRPHQVLGEIRDELRMRLF